MTQVEVKERLPDWPPSAAGFDTYRMNQLTQILERRLQAIDNALVELSFESSGLLGQGEFAPIEHTHGISEIVDFPADNLTVSNYPTLIDLGNARDFDDSGAFPGAVIKRNAANDGWEVGTDLSGGGGSFVPVITNPQQDDLLSYDAVQMQWENIPRSGLGFVQDTGDQMIGSLDFVDGVSARFGNSPVSRVTFDGSTFIVGTSRPMEVMGGTLDIMSSIGDLNLSTSAVELTLLSAGPSMTLVDPINDFDVGFGIRGSAQGIAMFARNSGAIVNDFLLVYTDGAGVTTDRIIDADLGGGIRFYHSDDLIGEFTDNELVMTGTQQTEVHVIGTGTVTGDAGYKAWGAGGGVELHFDEGADISRIGQLNASGVYEESWLQFTRNGGVQGFFDGTAVTETLAALSGGLQVNNTLTGAGFERVLTVSDITTLVDESRTLDVDGTANEIDVTPAGPLDLSLDRVWTVGLSDDPVVPGTGAITVPIGTELQRPSTPVNGMMRYNSDAARFEVYENGLWRSGQTQGGASLQGRWEFDSTTTSGDPGSGNFRYNNASYASVTAVFIADETKEGFDASTLLSLIDDGDILYIQEEENSNRFAAWDVNGVPTDNTTWWSVPVTLREGGLTLTDGKEAAVILFLGGGSGGGGGVPTSRTLDINGTTNEIDVTPAGPLDLTTDRVWTVGLTDDPVIPGVGSITIPDGTTAQEPTAVNGMLRYDSTTNKLRAVENGSWVDVIGAGGGASALNDLSDVTLTTPAAGDLFYRGATDWNNTSTLTWSETTKTLGLDAGTNDAADLDFTSANADFRIRASNLFGSTTFTIGTFTAANVTIGNTGILSLESTGLINYEGNPSTGVSHRFRDGTNNDFLEFELSLGEWEIISDLDLTLTASGANDVVLRQGADDRARAVALNTNNGGDQFPGAFEINRGGGFRDVAIREESIYLIDQVGSGDATKNFVATNYQQWITYYYKTDTTAVTFNIPDATFAELVGTAFIVSNMGSSANITVQRSGTITTFRDGTAAGVTSITVAPGEDKKFIRYANNAYRVLNLT